MIVHAVSAHTVKHVLLAAIGVVMAAAVARCNTGCAMFQSEAALDAAYAAELQNCVVVSKTRQEADKCRKLVDTKYNVCDVDGVLRPCK